MADSVMIKSREGGIYMLSPGLLSLRVAMLQVETTFGRQLLDQTLNI